MKCNCICKVCIQDANPTIPRTPTLCLACALAEALKSRDHGVPCNCTCGCKDAAQGDGPTPTLCTMCGLMNGQNSPDHGVPYTPPVWKPIEPSVPISDEQKDAAIEKGLDGLI